MDSNFLAEAGEGYVQVLNLSATTPMALGPLMPAMSPRLILIKVEGQSIRFRDDGTAPTATVGYPVAAGEEFSYTGVPSNQQNLSIIGQTAGATVNILFYWQD